MSRLWKRIRGALVLGAMWGITWGVVGGTLMELIFDPHGRIGDIWPMIFAIPGFIGGVIFSIVLATTENRRRFEDLSLGRTAGWGAIAGALLGVLGIVMLGMPPLLLGIPLVLGAASASGTLALARRGDKPELLKSGDDG